MTLHTILAAAADVLAAPAPTPTPGPTVTGTGAGVMGFILKVVAPILIAIVAVSVLGRARRGDMSAAVTSTGIVGIASVLLALAVSLAFLGLGDFFVKTLVQ